MVRYEEPGGRKVHTYSFSIPWGHLDALGHVNNTRYFGYFEEARIRWWQSLGGMEFLNANTLTGPILLKTECTFIRQIVYPCNAKVHLYVGDPGESSFSTWCELRSEDGTLHAMARSRTVWVDYKAEKSIPLPPEIRAVVAGPGEDL